MAGKKIYELSNHLGNVLVTISDRKLQMNETDGKVGFYLPDVLTMTDYDPFGMALFDRTDNGEKAYRFAFNGKEKLGEMYGNNNAYDFDARLYDPRIGRWLAVDPLAWKYANLSPYNFVANSPLTLIDPAGMDIVPSKDFLASNYGKLYTYLSTNNSVYKSMIVKYENNTKFNLKLGTDDSKIPSGAGAMTSYDCTVNCASVETETNYDSYFGKTGEMTVWHLYIMIHEGVHQLEPLSPGIPELNKKGDHEAFATIINKAVLAFTELSNELNLNWSSQQIQELSFYGAEGSQKFKNYMSDLATKNKTTVDVERAAYETRMSDLLAKTIKIPDESQKSVPEEPVKK